MKRLLSLMLVVATTLSTAACSSSDATGPAGSLSGTYTLTSLGGYPPPAPLYYNSASDHIEILSSQLRLFADGTYTDQTRVQDTNFGPTTTYDDNTAGSWTLSGNQLALQDRNDYTRVTYAFVTGNNRITIDNFSGYGISAAYTR